MRKHFSIWPRSALARYLAFGADAAGSRPLASWNDGPAKQAIVEFVTDVTAQGGPRFIPVEERIAVFNKDGTLWYERPVCSAHVHARAG